MRETSLLKFHSNVFRTWSWIYSFTLAHVSNISCSALATDSEQKDYAQAFLPTLKKGRKLFRNIAMALFLHQLLQVCQDLPF